MVLKEAYKLKIGDRVNFPADSGSPAGSGIIKFIGSDRYESYHGSEYIWVTLEKGGVWPSYRLTKSFFRVLKKFIKNKT